MAQQDPASASGRASTDAKEHASSCLDIAERAGQADAGQVAEDGCVEFREAAADTAEEQSDLTGPPGVQACQVCQERNFKYRCPGCGVQTCSLACSKSHKEDLGCSGKRRRTDFVPLDAFTERHLRSDIQLLEEVQRAEQLAARERPGGVPRHPPQWAKELHGEARRRGVNLELLQPGMQKRKANTTWVNRRKRQLHWHVEWHFVAAGCHISDSRVPDNTVLRDLLTKHLQSEETAQQPELEEYAEAGLEKLTVMLRQAHCPANDPKYFKMDLSKTLASQLQRKTVIEYPVLLVLLPHEVESYQEFVPPIPQPSTAVQ